MLQIRLRNVPSSEGGAGVKPVAMDTVTVACPDHLILADLPVAKGIGSATAASLVKNVGRRSRRQLGERVHFCVRCDFPIAIYGRLSPCDHAFCLDCARSDSICYLCDDRIQKIQTIKIMEGIFVCAAPHCLKSFLKKSEFESHIHETHADLLQPNTQKDGNESEAVSARQSTATESTARAPPRSVNSSSHVQDREDEACHPQPRDHQPHNPTTQPRMHPQFFGQIQNHPLEPQPDNNSQGFDRLPQSDTHVGMQQESSQSLDKQQGILSETPFPDYPPMQGHQPPNYAMPVNSNPGLPLPPFSYIPFPPEGAHPFYSVPYEMPRPDSAPEVGSEQGSLLGFPPGPAGAINFTQSFPRLWNVGPTGQGIVDGFGNMADPQGKAVLFQSDYGQNVGVLPSNMPLPSPSNNVMEPVQGGNAMDPRDGKGILAAPQTSPFPPLPPPPHNRDKMSDLGHDVRGFGWQHGGFGRSQD